MWLLLLAVICCLLPYIFNISVEVCFGMYIILIMVLKVIFSKSVKDVVSLHPIGNYLNKNAVYEFVSLGIMTLMYYTVDAYFYTITDIIFAIIIFILMYRFIVLGVIEISKNTK